jgi:hypothetical protein
MHDAQQLLLLVSTGVSVPFPPRSIFSPSLFFCCFFLLFFFLFCCLSFPEEFERSCELLALGTTWTWSLSKEV